MTVWSMSDAVSGFPLRLNEAVGRDTILKKKERYITLMMETGGERGVRIR